MPTAEVSALLTGAFKLAQWGICKISTQTVGGQIKRGKHYLIMSEARLNDPAYKDVIDSLDPEIKRNLLSQRATLENTRNQIRRSDATRAQAKAFHKDAKLHWQSVEEASGDAVYPVKLCSDRYSLEVAASDDAHSEFLVTVARINTADNPSGFHDVGAEMRSEFDDTGDAKSKTVRGTEISDLSLVGQLMEANEGGSTEPSILIVNENFTLSFASLRESLMTSNDLDDTSIAAVNAVCHSIWANPRTE
ncbi:hypothetical protein B0H10DRAFT_1071913 [Mycena sp. CBHHK59/15]|nr:hypothetical protein B0H10DRAFT_1071913 [Mycena sp. CBHHK59/15]